MANKKTTTTSADKSALIKIAEVIGTVAGEISVKKDSVSRMTSQAVDAVKNKIKNLAGTEAKPPAKSTAIAPAKTKTATSKVKEETNNTKKKTENKVEKASSKKAVARKLPVKPAGVGQVKTASKEAVVREVPAKPAGVKNAMPAPKKKAAGKAAPAKKGSSKTAVAKSKKAK